MEAPETETDASFPLFTLPSTPKRIVVEEDNLSTIIGWTVEQPPDILTLGDPPAPYGLIGLKGASSSYYLYKPILSPNAVMANFRGDGTFKPDQR